MYICGTSDLIHKFIVAHRPKQLRTPALLYTNYNKQYVPYFE